MKGEEDRAFDQSGSTFPRKGLILGSSPNEAVP